MWILFRVAMFFVGMSYRFFALSLFNARFTAHPIGVSLYVKNEQSRPSQQSSKVYLKIKSRLFFRIVPESASLSWYKSMGFGRELEVGEKSFDDTFYVAAENPGIVMKLRGDSELRATFLKLYSLGFTRFISDGFGHLLIENPNEMFQESDEYMRDFLKIKNALDIVPTSSFLSNPNVLSTLAIEIVGYGMAIYAYSFPLLSIFDGVTHLNSADYIIKGFFTSLTLILAWFVVLFGFLRRSARGLIFFYDCTLPYCLVALVSGFYLFGDLNQALDKSADSLNIAKVENKFSRTSAPPGRRRVHFYLVLNYTANPNQLPKEYAVDQSTYDNFSKGDGIEITVRNGFFNSPYVEGERAIPSPDIMSASTNVTYQRARDLARWIPTLNPKGELTGAVSWVEEKYPSGKIRQREPFVQNTRHGTATYWHENGVIYANISWRNGKKHGRVKISFPSGSIEQSLNYREGQLHGLCAWYDRDGRVTHMALYDNGDVISADMKFLSEIAKEVGGAGLR